MVLFLLFRRIIPLMR